MMKAHQPSNFNSSAIIMTDSHADMQELQALFRNQTM